MDSKNSTTCLCTTPSNGTFRELIFIQAGPSSNWIGAHFWNLQESSLFQRSEDSCFYLPALFRMNVRGSMSSLRPRLIAIDTLGSIRTPRMEMSSATPPSVTVAWDGNIQTIRQDDGNFQRQMNEHSLEVRGKNDEIRELEVSKSRFWTDCLLPAVKRRWNGEDTVVVLREYLDSSSPGDVFASPSRSSNASTSAAKDNNSTSFLSFAQGLDLYREGGDAFEYFEAYFHRLVEECDRPNGFSLLIDSDSGFAGVGLRLGEFLSEEFAKRPVFTSAISSYFQPSQFSRQWSTVCLNRLILFTVMEEATNWPSCSAWMPVTDTGNACAASSRLAAGLATLFTPILLNRDYKYSSELNGFINSLTPTHKKMMSLSLTTQDITKLQEDQIWTHANTFSMCYDTTQVSSRPRSLVCQLSTRGFLMEEGSFLPYLPRSRGYACFLEEGVDPRLSCSLPAAPLTLPRLSGTGTLLCTQPVRSRACALIEAVSHWTAENQWLARGLKLHMDCAFRKPLNPYLETDELRQLQESAVDHLLEAYASPDG
ncbi:protein misato 1 [Echinococcus multilocularis]|uniref:Protein misato 1 n=1 Tax=Echinococcus multilocularis TaxID=6211 RepID=A0A068Y8B7_ECHMU|nr:protein misato 1 [Echinococcus multilocularis]